MSLFSEIQEEVEYNYSVKIKNTEKNYHKNKQIDKNKQELTFNVNDSENLTSEIITQLDKIVHDSTGQMNFFEIYKKNKKKLCFVKEDNEDNRLVSIISIEINGKKITADLVLSIALESEQ